MNVTEYHTARETRSLNTLFEIRSSSRSKLLKLNMLRNVLIAARETAQSGMISREITEHDVFLRSFNALNLQIQGIVAAVRATESRIVDLDDKIADIKRKAHLRNTRDDEESDEEAALNREIHREIHRDYHQGAY